MVARCVRIIKLGGCGGVDRVQIIISQNSRENNDLAVGLRRCL